MDAERKLKRVMIVGGMIQKSPDGDKVRVSVNRDAYNQYEYERLMGRTNADDRLMRINDNVISNLSGR